MLLASFGKKEFDSLEEPCSDEVPNNGQGNIYLHWGCMCEEALAWLLHGQEEVVEYSVGVYGS